MYETIRLKIEKLTCVDRFGFMIIIRETYNQNFLEVNL